MLLVDSSHHGRSRLIQIIHLLELRVEWPIGSSNLCLLYQQTQSRVANSTSSTPPGAFLPDDFRAR